MCDWYAYYYTDSCMQFFLSTNIIKYYNYSVLYVVIDNNCVTKDFGLDSWCNIWGIWSIWAFSVHLDHTEIMEHFIKFTSV